MSLAAERAELTSLLLAMQSKSSSWIRTLEHKQTEEYQKAEADRIKAIAAAAAAKSSTSNDENKPASVSSASSPSARAVELDRRVSALTQSRFQDFQHLTAGDKEIANLKYEMQRTKDRIQREEEKRKKRAEESNNPNDSNRGHIADLPESTPSTDPSTPSSQASLTSPSHSHTLSASQVHPTVALSPPNSTSSSVGSISMHSPAASVGPNTKRQSMNVHMIREDDDPAPPSNPAFLTSSSADSDCLPSPIARVGGGSSLSTKSSEIAALRHEISTLTRAISRNDSSSSATMVAQNMTPGTHSRDVEARAAVMTAHAAGLQPGSRVSVLAHAQAELMSSIAEVKRREEALAAHHSEAVREQEDMKKLMNQAETAKQNAERRHQEQERRRSKEMGRS
jgi:hypothetical protein